MTDQATSNDDGQLMVQENVALEPNVVTIRSSRPLSKTGAEPYSQSQMQELGAISLYD